MPTQINIRFAQPTDLSRLVAIYNQAILAKNATGDLQTFAEDERKDWLDKFSRDEYPIYVAEIEDRVVGYCTLTPYRPGRQAMQKVAEISYYVDFEFHQRGVGSTLMKHAIGEARRLGKEAILAILLDINENSIHLLKKFGFQQWGLMPDIIQLQNRRCGHVIYGLRLLP